MTFKEYQKHALLTDTWGGKSVPIDSPAFMDKLLGLIGETGEVAEKFKKLYRDKGSKFTAADRADMQKELGDILWYLSVVSSYLSIDFNEVAEQNIAKLKSRLQRGTIHGSGDNR